MMLRRVNSKLNGLAFAARNINAARRLVEIKKQEIDGLLFRGSSASDVKAISEIYQELNDRTVFSWIQRGIYSLFGQRFLLVVEQIDGIGAFKIVGINIYYFNKRDVRENTVHEGFIGVIPEMCGQGIATKMRQMAIRHFKMAGFSGISTRISLSNKASLASAIKIGFQPIEDYQEPSTGERRYYMVCKF